MMSAGNRHSRDLPFSVMISDATAFKLMESWAHGNSSQVHSWLPFHVIVQLFRSHNLLLCHNNTIAGKHCWLFCCVSELQVVHCSDEIIHCVNNLEGTSKKYKGSYLLSQDCTEVNLYGIVAKYIVTVVDKKLWELCCNSHAVTIQWVHMVVDTLLPTCS